MCLNTPQGPICKCPDGFSLNGNGKKCIEYSTPAPATNCTGFLCSKTRECLNQEDVCDGVIDCLDGSDEDFTPKGICHKNNCNLTVNFVCDDVRCLHKYCNPTPICNDRRDQMNCSPGSLEDDEEDALFTPGTCPNFECDGLCLPLDNRCDGITQCPNGSDEMNCEIDCGTDEFYCPPLGCHSNSKKCDGYIDCFDASDENNCKSIASTDNHKEEVYHLICSENEFSCASDALECIPKFLVCDGYAHCSDRSDEQHCADLPTPSISTSITCEYPERLCRMTNKCLTVNQLCDGNFDCPNGIDEGFRCEEKICDRNKECSHFCHNVPEGFICTCPPHMFLLPNGKKCSMDHSCEAWDTCSQVCEKKGKSYECQCHEGYHLAKDRFTCKSNATDSALVIFSSRQEIRGIDLKSSSVRNIHSSLKNTVALDFLFSSEESSQIFWSDVIDDKIYRGYLMGETIRNVEAVIPIGLSRAEGLAVDWIGRNIYWIDSNLEQIEVALINGSFRRTLVEEDIGKPRAIALDPSEGLVFWTDWDKNKPRIDRCTMSGEKRKTITELTFVNYAWPNGITLDYIQKRVYWVDAKLHSIHSTNYEGTMHKVVLKDEDILSHPFDISLYENYIYWTDWKSDSVMRANKWNGSEIQVIQRTKTRPYGITVMHSSRQARIENPCGKNNGGCSHLCLLSTNRSYKCECPHIMRLDPKDGKNCIPVDQVLLFVVENQIRGIDLQQPNHHIIPTISQSSQGMGPYHIDFIVAKNQIYWSDVFLNEVKTAKLESGKIETVMNTDLIKPYGFAIDWIANNIYVSSGSKKCNIYAAGLEGQFVTLIHKDLGSVKSIVLDPAM